MKLRHLALHNFTVHRDTRLDFPETGLILVTGDNGSGKSSLVEAISVGLFGKPLRGASGWRAGEEGFVRVETDVVSVTRHRTPGGKNALAFTAGQEDAVEYESATHAQADLTALVGEHDVWRRSHVFSSVDASNFTTAADAKRKHLLEAILGLGRFDAALERCRADLASARRDYIAADGAERVLNERVIAADRRLAEAEERLAADAPAPGARDALEARSARLAQLHRACDHDCGEARQHDDDLRAVLATMKADVERLERRLDDLHEGVCYACRRPLPPKAQGDEAEARAELARAREAAQAAREARDVAAGALREVEGDRAALQGLVAEARAALDGADRAQNLRQNAHVALETIRAETQGLRRDLARAVAGRASHALEVGILEASETALGLRGIRAQVLGRALAGVEAVANAWLAKVSRAGATLQLRGYTEKKGGGVTDTIGLTFQGIGGEGYDSLSGGERRRVDAALAFALAEVAGAASGQAGGLMVADEIFDGLDQDGRAAAADVLRELATTNQVLVISHWADLAEWLKPTLHWRVSGGKVTR